jgi:hypothetical protein
LGDASNARAQPVCEVMKKIFQRLPSRRTLA